MNAYQPYTYLIGWTKYNIWYYGVRYKTNCHPSDLWNPYRTSSEYVKDFVNNYGEPDVKEIRRVFDTPKKAKLWEEKVLKKMKVVQSEKWLNKNDHHGPPSLWGHKHNNNRKQTEENIEKRKLAMIKAMAKKFPLENRKVRMIFGSEEYCEFMSNKSKELWNNRTEEERLNIGEKISIGLTGKSKTGRAAKGHKKTEDHVDKIRQSNIGKKRSDEVKEKLRQAKLGTKQSDEVRTKRSEKTKELWALRKSGLLPMPNYNKKY